MPINDKIHLVADAFGLKVVSSAFVFGHNIAGLVLRSLKTPAFSCTGGMERVLVEICGLRIFGLSV